MKPMILLVLLVTITRGEKFSQTCEQRNMCDESKTNIIPYCYCDGLCFYYNDCCKQYLQHHDTHNGTAQTLSETCQILTNDETIVSARVGAFMVDRCSETESHCNVTFEDLQKFLPVSSGNKTYVNADCAVCNNDSKFSYWDIAFSVSEDAEKKVKSGNISSNKEIVDEIMKDNMSVMRYYLHPPAGITPRFCPYDVISRDDSEALTHLNIVACDTIFYKNAEICIEKGCCRHKRILCSHYNMEFYIGKGHMRRSTTTFHVVMTFGQSEMNQKDTESIIQSVKYGGIDVNVILKLQNWETSSPPIDNCVLGVIGSLMSTTYRLVRVVPFYYSMIDKDVNLLIELSLQSTANLTPMQVKNLSNFQQSITCTDKRTSYSFFFELETKIMSVEHAEKEEPLKVKPTRHEMIDIERIKVSSTRPPDSCFNVSLTIHESLGNDLPVEISCLYTHPHYTSAGNSECYLTNMVSVIFSVTVGFAQYVSGRG